MMSGGIVMQSDIFKEVCLASTLNATKALSKFLHTPLGIDIKPVSIIKLNDVTKLISPDQITVNISLPINGDLSGFSYFLYSKQSALAICDTLFERSQGVTNNFSESEISGLLEVANVVIGNFLSTFANALQLNFLMHRAPTFDCSPFNNIFEQIQLKTEDNMKNAIAVYFNFQHLKIIGTVLIILDEDKINSFIKKISHASNG